MRFRLLITGLGMALLLSCSTVPDKENQGPLQKFFAHFRTEPSYQFASNPTLEFRQPPVNELLVALRGHDESARRKAIAALGQSHERSALDHLIEMLEDKDWLTRLSAAAAIEELHEERGREALKVLLQDPDTVVRLRAEHILANWKPSPNPSLDTDPRVMMRRADAAFEKEAYADAAVEYARFLDMHRSHEVAPYAQYRLGESYFKMGTSVDRDPTPVQRALEAFASLLKDYPGSRYEPAALTNIRQCQNWLAKASFLIGRFYYQRENYLAAAHRFEEILKESPEAEVVPEALFHLALAYKDIGADDWARERLVALAERYPHNAHQEESQTLLAQLNAQLPAVRVAQASSSTVTGPSSPEMVQAFSNRSEVDPPPEVTQTFLSPLYRGSLGTQATETSSGTSNTPPPVSTHAGTRPATGMALAGSTLNERIARLHYALQSGQRGCGSSAAHQPARSSFDLKGQVDCQLALPKQKGQVKFSYTEQRWERGSVDSIQEALEYMNDENNVAGSAGTMDLADEQLKANFELNHSHSTLEDAGTSSVENLGARVGIQGEQSRLKYWGEYSSYGNQFVDRLNDAPNDRAGGEAGAELKLGILKPKVELSRFYDNIKNDAETPQTLSSKGEFSIDVAVPNWPVLTLSYGREEKETAKRAGGPTTEEPRTDSIAGTLWHGGSTWEAYATSSYSSSQDRLNEGSDNTTYYYLLGGSYRPTDVLSITPSVDFTQTLQPESNYTYETLSSNLGLDYSSLEGTLGVSLYGSYVQNHDSDGYVDNESVDVSLGIVQDLAKILNLPHRKQTLTFKLTQSRYMDAISSDSDFVETSALLLFKIVP